MSCRKSGLRRFAVVTAICLTLQSPAMAQAGRGLPIGEGAWVDADVPCGQTQTVFAYYGGRFGELTAYDGGVDGTLEPVAAPTPADEGFTTVRGGYDDYIHVKALPNGRAVVRAGSVGATGRDFSADTVVRPCAPATLPASLRAALAPHVGGAAGQPAVASSGADQPGPPVPPLGIAAGYYAEGEEPCSGNGMLFYYDGRNYAWIDLSPFQPGLLTPVGQPRRARGALVLEDGAMTVAGPTRFTWRDINGDIGDTPMRWCPAGEVRASARLR